MIRINGRESNISHLLVKGERRKLREKAALFEAAAPGGGGEGGYAAIRWDGALAPGIEAALRQFGARIRPGMDEYLRGVSEKGTAEKVLARMPLGRKRNFRLIDEAAQGRVAKQVACNERIAQAVCAIHLELLHLKRCREDLACGVPAAVAVHSGEREKELAEVLLARGEGAFFFLGLPGVEAYERMLEEERLAGGASDDRFEATYYQANFLPVVCMDYRGLLRDERTWRLAALALPHPERFDAALLELVMRMASLHGYGGEMWFAAARGEEERGMPRAAMGGRWSSAFVCWLADKHGFTTEVVPGVHSILVRVRGA
ncbi:MAG: hypothetical protein H5T73_02010 [Actinobacteria bacterium]|nr:hypothetical protein [Actinomycetota bacterium]